MSDEGVHEPKAAFGKMCSALTPEQTKSMGAEICVLQNALAHLAELKLPSQANEVRREEQERQDCDLNAISKAAVLETSSGMPGMVLLLLLLALVASFFLRA